MVSVEKYFVAINTEAWSILDLEPRRKLNFVIVPTDGARSRAGLTFPPPFFYERAETEREPVAESSVRAMVGMTISHPSN